LIRHASIYDYADYADYAAHQGCCLKVLVMRYWPRGIRRSQIDVWLRDAAPSRHLLRLYAHDGLPWPEFERAFRTELEARDDVLERLRALEHEHGCLTLLCHERIPPREHCHREILAALLAT
jgi:uncharacterized protein YeaO (DUF488 family)